MDEVEARTRAHLARGAYEEAATEAIQGYGPGIVGYLCNILEEDDAHDVFSRFAEDLWRGLPGFRGECSVRAWAYRLAWHAAARFLRDPYRRRRERLTSSVASRLAASIASASGFATSGRRDRLAALRKSLTPEEQTLLVLRIDRELEWEEVAAVLAAEGQPVTPATLRKRFERLRQKLEQLALDQGLIE